MRGRTDSALARLVDGCLLASFHGPTAPDWLMRRIDGGLAGVTLFSGNVAGREELAALSTRLRSAAPGFLVTLDEEGGDVTRVHAATGSPHPGNAALGAIDDEALTEAVARAMGAELAALGVNLDLAPCVDVNSNPANPVIGVRSFGADPALVARHSAAFVRGLQAAGVAACAKHFPGHGDTEVDSHLDLPRVDVDGDTLRSRELVPFRTAIGAGVASIMTSHVLLPALDGDRPATVSRAILVDLLREELGFDGVIVSDALDMKGICVPDGIPTAAVRTLRAGADLLCLGSEFDDDGVDVVRRAIIGAVRSGDLAEERVAEAAARTARLAGSVASWSGPGTGPTDDIDLTALAERALRVDGTLPRSLVGAHIVVLEPRPGSAVGAVPWSPAAAMQSIDPTVTVSTLRRRDVDGMALPERPSDRPLVVVARDAHRHDWQSRLVADLRPEVLVEMGWPGPDRLDGAATTVHTFGAGRSSGEAVARLLCTPSPSGVRRG